MHFFQAIIAIFKGVEYCLVHKEIRKLAFWPWAVGSICYLSTLFAAYELHPVVLHWIVNSPDGFWSSILFYICWVIVAFLLILASMISSIALVMIFTSVFQTAIAMKVLADMGYELPAETSGLKSTLSEAMRSILVETGKLVWLLPLMTVVLLMGFIPMLLPLSLIAGAWLLAYQFVDIVLDIYRIGVVKRFAFAAKNGFFLCLFGMTLMLCWAVPFVGLLLPPAAVAGAAWMLGKSGLLIPVAEERKLQIPTAS